MDKQDPGRFSLMLLRIAGTLWTSALFVCIAHHSMANDAFPIPPGLPGALTSPENTKRAGLIDTASPCSSERGEWFTIYCALMADPIRALPQIETIEREIIGHAHSTSNLFDLLTKYRREGTTRIEQDSLESEMDRLLAEADDPLMFGMKALQPEAAANSTFWGTPGREHLSGAPRFELGRLLLALARAEHYRRQAFAKLPASMSANQWIEGLANQGSKHVDPVGTLVQLGEIDTDVLDAGMRIIVSATQRFRNFALSHHEWPSLAWQLETHLGLVIIDLSDANTERAIPRPLLLIDRGGNDRYRFVGHDFHPPISVLIDLAGDDGYLTDESALCPSAAIMGYGILWDETGNDRYRGTHLAQSAAVLGNALLYDGSGEDEFDAQLQSQSFAFIGTALLVNGGNGADRYTALSQAQGSAAPSGVALLLDAGGNDHYTLGREPIIVPSAQLPDRNASLGQGSAFGLRTQPPNPRLLGGGIGILFDQTGNDVYRAQVFAQGSGYFHGMGILIDGDGQDIYQASWYAQGAAAHGAIGALIDRGKGDDHYTATHSTSIGAAHDHSLALLLDSAGNDHYEIGGLGFAAAHQESVALFFDLEGTDAYQVAETSCRAFGVAIPSPSSSRGARTQYQGIFIDAEGEDRFPEHCTPKTRGSGNSDERPYRSVSE